VEINLIQELTVRKAEKGLLNFIKDKQSNFKEKLVTEFQSPNTIKLDHQYIIFSFAVKYG